MKAKRYKTLVRWILSGCIVLMIPILCAMVNFFINKELIERKINQVNNFILRNIQYNIDARLEDMNDISRYILLDPNFTSYKLNTEDSAGFINQIQKCYETLKSYYSANPDLDIMLYIPREDYVLTSSTANQAEYIYNTLATQKKMPLSLEEWKAGMSSSYQNTYLISDVLSYRNSGSKNLVYATRSLYSYASSPCTIFVSTSTDFIEKLLESEQGMGSIMLILDEEGNVIGQYGDKHQVKHIDLGNRREGENLTLQLNGEEYVSAVVNSDVAKWSYVVCTPKTVYMDEIVKNRNLNLLIVLLGLIVGTVSVIFLQRHNYQPVRKLMDAIQEKDGQGEANEFDLVERNLKRLYHENKSMKDSIERRIEYDRELFLYSRIKGRNSFFREKKIEEIFGVDCSGKRFALVSINLDLEDDKSGSAVLDNFELLEFSVNNVMGDLFSDSYLYLKTIDDVFIVYCFLLDGEGAEENWEHICRNNFVVLYEFFQKHFERELSITTGGVFDAFDSIETSYSEIQEANEHRYFSEPYGVVAVTAMQENDITSTERLKYFSKRFEEILENTDIQAGKKTAEELFQELGKVSKPFNSIQFYMLSIVNDLLLTAQTMVKEQEVAESALESVLQELRTAGSLPGLQSQFVKFLKILCQTVDEDSRKSSGLSESIVAYVKENFKDQNMNISTIAEEIGITPRYMSKIFKDQTGVGLLTYINDVRIEEAKRLLKHTRMTVDEIAEATGFTNARTFRRNFLKLTGENAIRYKSGAGR